MERNLLEENEKRECNEADEALLGRQRLDDFQNLILNVSTIIEHLLATAINNFLTSHIVVGDWMFLGMQDFDFCPNLIKFSNFTQILSSFTKFYTIYPNLIKFLPKFYSNLSKFCLNLPKKFPKKICLKNPSAFLASPAPKAQITLPQKKLKIQIADVLRRFIGHPV